jgi:hypothetical protein
MYKLALPLTGLVNLERVIYVYNVRSNPIQVSADGFIAMYTSTRRTLETQRVCNGKRA